MGLDDLGEAIVGGALEGLASSLPMPPSDPSLPPPPHTPGDDRAQPREQEQEPSRSTVPVVLAVVLTVLVAAGAFAVVSWARAGGACDDADFASTRFGYCAVVPGGWVAAAAEGDGAPLDRFLLQGGPAVITVTAVPLTRGQDLARFEQFVRGYVEAAGGTASASTVTEVDGVDALTFDATLAGPDGDVRSREVLFEREGIAWRVTLADEQMGFEASTQRLGELLESWRFA
ncbi:MAG TPA: hypothetical protein VF351_09145 [Actinomycetota bacterium]